MSQINLSKTSEFIPPPQGRLGYGFDEYGNPCVILEDGSKQLISSSSTLGGKNIIANKGVGLESNLPTTFVQGDIYVTNDTYKVYTAGDAISWQIVALVEGQLVTDAISTNYLLYQFIEGALVYLDAEAGFLVRIKVWNDTAFIIPKGKLVTPLSNYNGFPTIQYASSNVKLKSKLVAMVYKDIPPNSGGTVVKLGPVTGINVGSGLSSSIVYLTSDGSGDFTTERQHAGAFDVIIGAIGAEGSNGSIIVDIIIPDNTIEVNDTNGFPTSQRNNTTLSKNEITRTFLISPIVTPFHYYVEAEKFEKSTPCPVQWTDTEGEHWFYFTGEDLICTHNPSPALIEDVILKYAFVASIYWNAVDKKCEFDIFEERHGINMPASVHLYNHKYLKAQYDYGFALGDFILGAGTSDTHTQYSISAGNYSDEDINHPGLYSPPNAEVPVSFLLGSSYFRTREQINFSVLNATNGRLYYNQLLTGNYFLTEVGNNNYVIYHRFVVNGLTKRYITTMGQSEYSTLESVYNAVTTEASVIKNGFTVKEAVLIGSIIYQTRNANITVNTTWTRTADIITVTSPNHKLITGEVINVSVIGGSQTTGNKTITVIDSNIFTFVGVASGNSTGSLTYIALAFTNTVKARIIPQESGAPYLDHRTAALGKGVNPTSHQGLTDVLKAAQGVTDGHIDDQAQNIAGPKTMLEDFTTIKSIKIGSSDTSIQTKTVKRHLFYALNNYNLTFSSYLNYMLLANNMNIASDGSTVKDTDAYAATGIAFGGVDLSTSYAFRIQGSLANTSTITILLDLLRNGNLGIGIISPSEKLEVNGNLKLTDTIRFTGVELKLINGTANSATQVVARPSGTSTNMAAFVVADAETNVTGVTKLGFLGYGGASLPTGYMPIASIVAQTVYTTSLPIGFIVSNVTDGRFVAMNIQPTGNMGVGIVPIERIHSSAFVRADNGFKKGAYFVTRGVTTDVPITTTSTTNVQANNPDDYVFTLSANVTATFNFTDSAFQYDSIIKFRITGGTAVKFTKTTGGTGTFYQNGVALVGDVYSGYDGAKVNYIAIRVQSATEFEIV